ncbi:unnamed protein product, partial [Prorocentrum cordatum]
GGPLRAPGWLSRGDASPRCAGRCGSQLQCSQCSQLRCSCGWAAPPTARARGAPEDEVGPWRERGAAHSDPEGAAQVNAMLASAGLGGSAERVVRCLGVEVPSDFAVLEYEDLVELGLKPVQRRRLWRVVEAQRSAEAAPACGVGKV